MPQHACLLTRSVARRFVDRGLLIRVLGSTYLGWAEDMGGAWISNERERPNRIDRQPLGNGHWRMRSGRLNRAAHSESVPEECKESRNATERSDVGPPS